MNDGDYWNLTNLTKLRTVHNILEEILLLGDGETERISLLESVGRLIKNLEDIVD